MDKKEIPNHKHCGKCGDVYYGEFNWDLYCGDINFFMEGIKGPLCDKCYNNIIESRGYDG